MSNYISQNPLPKHYAKYTHKNGISRIEDCFGNSFPSITHIIDKTRTSAEKAQFKSWRQRVGNSVANSIISESKQLGILGNRQIEQFFYGKNIPCPQLIQSHWKNLKPHLEQIHNVRLLEGHVFDKYEGYAGRVDCIATYADLPESVIEFKFSDRIKPIYQEKKLQLVAYAGAINQQYRRPPSQVKITHALHILVTPDEVDITIFDSEELTKYWYEWQNRVKEFWELSTEVA